jgi:DNA polymerase-3 subunit delta
VKTLTNRQFHQIYLFYGPETFLFRESLKKLRLVLQGRNPSDFDFAVFDGEECSASDVCSAIQTLPLFDSCRLIVVNRFDKLGKEHMATIAAELEDVPEMSHVVLVTNAERIDGRLTLVKLCRSKGLVVNLRRLYPTELDLWVKARAKFLGFRFDNDALELFKAVAGNDLWNVENELEKTGVYLGRDEAVATYSDVKSILASTPERSVFEIVDAMSRRDSREALSLGLEMIDNGAPLPLMVALLTRQISLLLKTKVTLEEHPGRGPKQVAATLGVATYAAQKCIEQHSNFTYAELKHALSKLADTEKSIKTGESSGALSLELAILSIVAPKA